MSSMQIDLPSRPVVRSTRNKRPRSPASPSPHDRPLKHTILAPDSTERSPSLLLEHTVQKQELLTTAPQLPAFQKRNVSDDWVAKTSGLKLDSPLLGADHGGRNSLPETGKWSCMESSEIGCVEDEPMITDMDDANPMIRGPWHASSAEHTTLRSAFGQRQTLDAFSSPLHSTRQPSMLIIPSEQSDDRIQATPSCRGSRRSCLTYSTAMSISPSNSGVWRPPTPSSRKPRVSMGPRPDCEKCKNGLKGHWMHID